MSFDVGSPLDTAFLPKVFDFVEYRARVGLPLSCLDLSECRRLVLSDSSRGRPEKLVELTVRLLVVSAE
ncbi:hypothetical protein CPC08DRAFT_197418 [Agrocybe pediades]|nr:hypothetical protein CPC08DRAFT_197418 [Agrocybe pediades]